MFSMFVTSRHYPESLTEVYVSCYIQDDYRMLEVVEVEIFWDGVKLFSRLYASPCTAEDIKGNLAESEGNFIGELVDSKGDPNRQTERVYILDDILTAGVYRFNLKEKPSG